MTPIDETGLKIFEDIKDSHVRFNEHTKKSRTDWPLRP